MSDIRIQFKQTLGEQKFDIDVSVPEKGITAILVVPEQVKLHL